MISSSISGFKQFILRGNVVDLAVGIAIGSAFSGIVNAIVKDLITPIIGAFGKVADFSDLYFTINGSKFMYGDFFNSLISFIIIAFVVYFFIVLPMNALIARTKKSPVPAEPTQKKCPECLSDIPVQASRCSHCTTKLA